MLFRSTGTIKDLYFDESYPVIPFITIGALDFNLTSISFNGSTAIGDCTGPNDTSSGASCTPANSPFTLTNGLCSGSNCQADTVSITLTLNAEGYTGSSGTGEDPYVGVFSTQEAGMNIASILSAIEGSPGYVTASWSATFTPLTSTPEPASFLLLGAGLTVIGLAKRSARKS